MLSMKYRGAKDNTFTKPKIVYDISNRHLARMVNPTKKDAQGNTVKKPRATVSYNNNMGEVERIDQQLHGIQVLRQICKWYQKIFVYLLMFSLLSS